MHPITSWYLKWRRPIFTFPKMSGTHLTSKHVWMNKTTEEVDINYKFFFPHVHRVCQVSFFITLASGSIEEISLMRNLSPNERNIMVALTKN